jgi:hypothetical protein
VSEPEIDRRGADRLGAEWRPNVDLGDHLGEVRD